MESQAWLWLALCCHMQPKRSDFGRMHVVAADPYEGMSSFWRDDPERPGRLQQCAPVRDGNFVVLHEDGIEVSIVLTDYKTYKRYGVYREQLAPGAAAAVRASLALFPRQFLFVGTDDLPFDKGYGYDGFGNWVARVFESVGLPGTRINDLRRAAVARLPGQATNESADDVAREMLHSPWVQQRQYKFVTGESSAAYEFSEQDVDMSVVPQKDYRLASLLTRVVGCSDGKGVLRPECLDLIAEY